MTDLHTGVVELFAEAQTKGLQGYDELTEIYDPVLEMLTRMFPPNRCKHCRTIIPNRARYCDDRCRRSFYGVKLLARQARWRAANPRKRCSRRIAGNLCRRYALKGSDQCRECSTA